MGAWPRRYEGSPRRRCTDKKKGHTPAKVAEPEDTNVVDLMSALRASLSAKGKGPAKAEPKAKPKPAAAKPKARKAS